MHTDNEQFLVLVCWLKPHWVLQNQSVLPALGTGPHQGPELDGCVVLH